MKHFFKKFKGLLFFIILFVCFESLQSSKVSAMAYCLTDPWGSVSNPVDNRCMVTAVITASSSVVVSGGNTNITVDGTTLYQWSTGGFGDYSVTMTNASGTLLNTWNYTGGFDFLPGGGPVTFNSGALTGPVTVEFCATSDQLVTTCSTLYITIEPPCSWIIDTYEQALKCNVPFSYLPSPLPSCSLSNVIQMMVGCVGLTQTVAHCECSVVNTTTTSTPTVNLWFGP
jgi:hypothetical protein